MSIYQLQQSQLTFDAPAAKALTEPEPPPSNEFCSELSLSGQPHQCLSLLAPILKSLSEQREERWLTLISPPAQLTRQWLKDTGLDTERTLIVYPKNLQSSQELCCKMLSLGRSHTVISWLNQLVPAARERLAEAARRGQAHSINVAQSW